MFHGKKIRTLESKESGSNPASSAECQFKVTKHLRLLFPHLWCRNWCPPCRMTGGTKWAIHKPWTSSVLSKHCSFSRSSVRQSESPHLTYFIRLQRRPKGIVHSEARRLGLLVGGQSSHPDPAASCLCHLGQVPEPGCFFIVKTAMLSAASPWGYCKD